MQHEKERAKGASGLSTVNWSVCLSARSEEADLNGSIKARRTSPSLEVHFTLNPFLFLALPLPSTWSFFFPTLIGSFLFPLSLFRLLVSLVLVLFSHGESYGSISGRPVISRLTFRHQIRVTKVISHFQTKPQQQASIKKKKKWHYVYSSIPHSSFYHNLFTYIPWEKQETANVGIAHYPNSLCLMVCQHE